MDQSQTQPEGGSQSVDFFGDGALEDPADDALGYAPFATKLSDALLKLKPQSGLVLALYGSWGGGKSTMLNFVEKDLGKRAGIEPPIIVRFNPWWFSGQEDLARVFFEELIRGLNLESLADKVSKGIRDAIPPLLRILGKAVSKVPEPVLSFIGVGAPFVPAVGAGIEQLGTELKQQGVKTLTEAKLAIEDKLRRIPSKILVIIDDLDRLTADEIRQMFRLIKAVANFSNIVYVLAFDKEIVTKALNTEQASGEDYLAKIVQIAFELPLPDREALRKMLDGRLEKILGSEPFDKNEWSRAYGRSSDGISHFMKTPRNVVQLTNYLSLSYPSVRGEVNAIDFVTIEALRVHCSSVYDLIRKNQDLFCFPSHISSSSRPSPSSGSGIGLPPPPGWTRRGPPGAPVSVPLDPTRREFHQSELKKLVERKLIDEEDVEPVRRLLVQMFPMLTGVFPVPDEFDVTLEPPPPPPRGRGICYDDRFQFYFRLSPPEGGISQAEVIRASRSVEAFRAELKKLADAGPRQPGEWNRPTNKSELVLTELSQNIGEVSETIAGEMFIAAFDFVGLRPDKPWFLTSLLSNLLGRVPMSARLSVLKKAVESTEHIETSIELVRDLQNVHDTAGAPLPPPLFRDADQQPLVGPEHLMEIRTFVAAKIERAAEGRTFLTLPRLRLLLACWNAWGDRGRLKEWGRKVVENPKTLAQLIAGFLEEDLGLFPPVVLPGGVVASGQDMASNYFVNPQWFSMFIELSELVSLASKLSSQTDLSDREKIAVDALLKTYEQEVAEQKRNPFGFW